ncbi:MAG TPA: DNA polymerase I [Terriglobia bacterium]|nr:DNA polymerase I [Terriglobia bacterium]
MGSHTASRHPDSAHSPARPAAGRLFLLDTMGYIFRAYHALPRLTNRSGMATQAVYGLNNMLKKLMAEYQPEYLAAVFDRAEPTFRHESFAGYKANRAEMPEELAAQLPYIHRLLEALRIPELSQAGYEADDVIGSVARQAASQGYEVFVISSDKDMLQLVQDRIRVINPMKDTVFDVDQVKQAMGVPPEKIPDLMALMGDSVDNIPGAPGIGPKGAQELIQKYGSVEACLEHAAEVSRKSYREALERHRQQVLMSKALATIDVTAPVEFSLERLRAGPPDPGPLRELYQELGFASLLKELPAAEEIRCERRRIASERELQELLPLLCKETPVALAVGSESAVPESHGRFAFGSGVAMALAMEAGVAYEIDPALTPKLRGWLEDPERPKSIHDSKTAQLVLREQQVKLAGVRHDTFLYSYLLDATETAHDLGSVVERRFGTRLSGGLAEQADWTARLAALLEPEIKEQGLERVYAELDLPLAAILAEMERAGVRLDPRPLAELSKRLERDLEALREEIFRLTGTEFNINSPKQLGQVLFEQMGLPAPRRRGKTKAPSTAVDVLEELAAEHEVPRRVLEYRQLSKLKSTYVDALPQYIHPATGRLHTSYNQAGSATGRLSSSNPNLQNIPIRTELGREIRAAFVAETDCLLLAADYSQIELRLLAHFSEDPLLVEAFRRNEDIHALTAAAVFGVPAAEQTAEHRRRAKAINYGIVYGISPFGLAQQLGVSQEEAAQFIASYFSRYQGVRRFLDATLEETRRTGQARTLFGRLRRIPDIHSKDPNARGFAERTAINTPLQGSAADLIKLAMIRVDRGLKQRRLAARMILQVHDELVLEAPIPERREAAALLREGMETCYPLRVPLVASVAAGPNWRDLEDIAA